MASTSKANSKATSEILEEGQIEDHDTGDVPTPLGKVHREKMRGRFNAERIVDSLERPTKAPKRLRQVSESSEESSTLESSFMN